MERSIEMKHRRMIFVWLRGLARLSVNVRLASLDEEQNFVPPFRLRCFDLTKCSRLSRRLDREEGSLET